MKRNAKYIVMSVASIGQIVGIVLLFVNIKIALGFYLVYVISTIVLFILLVKERLKEKREDEERDYRDY